MEGITSLIVWIIGSLLIFAICAAIYYAYCYFITYLLHVVLKHTVFKWQEKRYQEEEEED